MHHLPHSSSLFTSFPISFTLRPHPRIIQGFHPADDNQHPPLSFFFILTSVMNLCSTISTVLVFLFFLVCTAPGASSKSLHPCSSQSACGTRSICITGRCYYRRDHRCSNSPSATGCEPTTECVHGFCRRIAKLGQSCHQNHDYYACDKGLKCDNHVCKLGENAGCKGKSGSCATGTVCIGRPDKKRCRKPMQAGGRCGTDPFWVCAKDLDCGEDNICRVRRGDVCLRRRIGNNNNDDDDDDDKDDKKTLPCVKGTKCIGTRSLKRCVKPNGPGGACAIITDPFAICEPGLKCEKKVCKVPRGKSCLRNGNIVPCVSGTKCVGNDKTKKVCNPPVRAGGRCQPPFRVCDNNLKCESRRCKLLQGQSCETRTNLCAAGLKCVGLRGQRKCFKLVGLNGKCDRKKPFSQCLPGLTCTDKNVCRINIGGKCTGKDDECVDGADCLGPRGNRRCTVRKKVGQPCSTKQLSVLLCKIGLKCDKNNCRIPVGGDCLNPDVGKGSKLGNNNGCVNNAQCVGTRSKKTCRVPAGPGGACDTKVDAGKPCQSNLKCEGRKCRIRAGHDCTKHPNDCDDGTKCLNVGNTKRCKKAVPLGGKCGSRASGPCVNGLQCDARVCKLRKGAECGATPELCAKGLTCLKGSGNKKVCTEDLGPGQQCTVDHKGNSNCRKLTECFKNRCRIIEGGSCGKFPGLCSRDLRCVVKRGTSIRRCRKPLLVGQRCNLFPSGCVEGLRCDQGVCRIAEGRPCEAKPELVNDGCAIRTACINKRCRKQVPLNGPCRTDSVGKECMPGLVCDGLANGQPDVNGRCKLRLNSPCRKFRGTPCKTGTSCINDKCRPPSPPGGKCNVMGGGPKCGPRSMCEDGVCRLRANAVCTSATRELCAKGLVCAGDGKPGLKRCKPRVGLLQRCDTDRNVGRICDENLECDPHDWKCRIPHDEDCSRAPHGCATNARCVRQGRQRVCKHAMQAGEKCTKDPLWVCDEGLLCQNHVCKVNVGGACNIPMHECASGMHCGPRHVCVR